MTTRKPNARFALELVLACVVFGGAGCATPGPLHLYSLPNATAAQVADTGVGNAAEVPSFLHDGETVTGFAYDPFTDHFFLRLAPGNLIRVVDRPARAVKREFKVTELSTVGGGDLAIRPRDGHVFALEPAGSTLVEFTRYGEFVRRIALDALPGPAAGVAYDSNRDQLFVLNGGELAHVTTHALDGRFISSLTLNRPVATTSLAFDSEKKELYVPLVAGNAVGVFGEDGQLRRELPLRATFLDVGPRSFLRMF